MKYFFQLATFAAAVFVTPMTFAQTPPATSETPVKSPWAHESEASVVQVGGNTKSESYSAKQKTSYKVDLNTLTVAGRYLQTKSAGVETAKAWDASGRYERDLSTYWAAFVQHGAESDGFAGYVQRDNSDVGGKYYFVKEDAKNFFSELGYRYSKTNLAGTPGGIEYTNSGRLYVEYTQKFNESVSGRLWAEYLPNFKDADAYLANYEPSVTAMLNEVFSLKVAYLVKYHNKTVAPTEEKNDTTFTTSLVAKF